MQKRAVYVRLQGDTYFVRFLDRSKGQRYLAASFYAPDTTLRKVEAWVRAQPNLVLVNGPA